jgi:hypothetical protein
VLIKLNREGDADMIGQLLSELLLYNTRPDWVGWARERQMYYPNRTPARGTSPIPPEFLIAPQVGPWLVLGQVEDIQPGRPMPARPQESLPPPEPESTAIVW